MDRAEFIQGFRDLGLAVEEMDESFISFDWRVPSGSRARETIRIALAVPADIEETPPSGPHVSPRLYPIHPDNAPGHPLGGIHESPLGDEWQYWSRPYPPDPGWAATARDAKAYIHHLNHLFDTL